MPTIFKLLGLRFFYLSYDMINEPCHIHVSDDGGKLCKYWIRKDGSITLADTTGFTARERKRIESAITKRISEIQEHYEINCRNNKISINYYKKA